MDRVLEIAMGSSTRSAMAVPANAPAMGTAQELLQIVAPVNPAWAVQIAISVIQKIQATLFAAEMEVAELPARLLLIALQNSQFAHHRLVVLARTTLNASI